MKGFSAKNSPTGGFISPSSGGRRPNLLSGSGTPLGGTPNRMGGLKKEGGIKVIVGNTNNISSVAFFGVLNIKFKIKAFSCNLPL